MGKTDRPSNNTALITSTDVNGADVVATEKGVAMLEVAISFTVFILVLFLSIDLLIYTYNIAGLQTAMTLSTRESVLKNTPAGIDYASFVNVIRENMHELTTFTPEEMVVEICEPNGTYSPSCHGNELLPAEAVMKVAISYELPSLIGTHSYPVSGSVIVRNEPGA